MSHLILDALPEAPRFVSHSPRGLRDEADHLSDAAFAATYSPANGPLRLGNWECSAHRSSNGIGAPTSLFRASIAVGDRIGTAVASAHGPVAALTAMLADRGVAVEVREFHQRPVGGGTATYVHGSDGARARWAVGHAQDPTESALHALIACANRLLSATDPALD